MQSLPPAPRSRGHARLKRFVTAGRNKWADGSRGSAEIDSRPGGDLIISRAPETSARFCSFLQADRFYREGIFFLCGLSQHLVRLHTPEIPDGGTFGPEQLQDKNHFCVTNQQTKLQEGIAFCWFLISGLIYLLSFVLSLPNQAKYFPLCLFTAQWINQDVYAAADLHLATPTKLQTKTGKQWVFPECGTTPNPPVMQLGHCSALTSRDTN